MSYKEKYCTSGWKPRCVNYSIVCECTNCHAYFDGSEFNQCPCCFSEDTHNLSKFDIEQMEAVRKGHYKVMKTGEKKLVEGCGRHFIVDREEK